MIYWSPLIFLVCNHEKSLGQLTRTKGKCAFNWKGIQFLKKNRKTICTVNFCVSYSFLFTLLFSPNKDCFHLSNTKITWTILQAVSQRKDIHMPKVYTCASSQLFGENMLHVLLALLVLHFELMQFILIYDNCLKDLLSIFPIYKELFTKRGKSRRESRSLCIVRCKNWVDSVLESALCSRADCQDVFWSTIFCMFGDRNEIKEKLSSS